MYQTAITDTRYTRRNFLLRDQLDELLPRDQLNELLHRGVALPESTQTDSITALYGKGEFTLFDERHAGVTGLFGVRTHSVFSKTIIRPPVHNEAMTDSPAVTELISAGIQSRPMARTLDALIERAREEHFEDGMNSNLSIGIRVLLRNFGEAFASVVDERLERSDISARILGEILHTLGHIDDDASRDWRFATLVRFLKSPSPLTRDAAAVGLSYLDDKRAVPYLQEAIRREANAGFREDLRAIVDQFAV